MSRLAFVAHILLAPLLLAAPAERASAADCRQAIVNAALREGVPVPLALAVGRVESGRHFNGETVPWSLAIGTGGAGEFPASVPDAVAATKRLMARGVMPDVGCMQISLRYHANAFSELSQAFDPVLNSEYGVRYLRQLFERYGRWGQATAHYNSSSPGAQARYLGMVLAQLDHTQAESRVADLGDHGRPRVRRLEAGETQRAARARSSRPSVIIVRR